MLMNISDLQPSQLYLLRDKVDAVKSWLDKENFDIFEPITIRSYKDQVVIIDGHTRAFVTYSLGCDNIPVRWDNDKEPWPFYEQCVQACLNEQIYTVSDLENRILNHHDFKEKWLNFCQDLGRS